jgi:hypothetical protein
MKKIEFRMQNWAFYRPSAFGWPVRKSPLDAQLPNNDDPIRFNLNGLSDPD